MTLAVSPDWGVSSAVFNTCSLGLERRLRAKSPA
jgi:hypothetical protein